MRQGRIWAAVALAIALIIGGVSHVRGASWEVTVHPGEGVEIAAVTEHARIVLKL